MKQVIVPQYIKDLMKRASFSFKGYYVQPGYTISISKYSEYSYTQTLKQEVERLISWAQRECRRIGMDRSWSLQAAVINEMPYITRYEQQYAVVTIFDPIMKYLEQYIPETKNS